MINKVIQISDIHIPNDETKKPFGLLLDQFLEQLYHSEIEDQNSDEIRIVLCGDIFEHKLNTKNEAITTFHNLLNKCNKFCKTYIIAGNHDMLDSNHDRVDSIMPTFTINEGYSNIVYLEKELNFKSGYWIDDNIIWNVFSRYDNFNSTSIKHDDYPNHKIIGLFHGDIKGSVTDAGYKSTEGVNLDIFNDCDCVMAGHIHKYQTLYTNNNKPIVYASSLFQHDIGENVSGHGYVVWNINTMDYTFKEVENDYCNYKYIITSSNEKELEKQLKKPINF